MPNDAPTADRNGHAPPIARFGELCGQLYRAASSPGCTMAELADGRSDLRALLDDIDRADPAVPMPIGLADLVARHRHLHEPVVEGLLRRGETANVIAPTKVGKSWLTYDLALSIVMGREWLGTFATRPGRVLLIDNELHAPTIASRIPRVAEARQMPPKAIDGIDVVSLRGDLTDYYGLGHIIERIERGQYAAIVVDAHYRLVPSGTGENDNAEMARVFNLIDQYAARTGAAWILVHHSTKGSQSDKRVTDVGAGAGSQSRAADTHLVLREHEEAGHVVLDAAVRSFPPVDPVVLKWMFPLWAPRPDMSPAALKGRKSRHEQRSDELDTEHAQKLRETLAAWTDDDGPATKNKLAERTGCGRTRAGRLLARLVDAGEVGREPVKIRGNQTERYYLQTAGGRVSGGDV